MPSKALALSGLFLFAIIRTVAAADIGLQFPTKAVPAAPAPFSGYFELFAGGQSESSKQDFGQGFANKFTLPGWTWGGAARANLWLAPNVSSQFDAWGSENSWNKIDFFGDQFTTSNIAGGAHLSWRDPNRFLLGVFAAGGSSTFAQYALGGLEGQLYLGNVTLYGQIGYQGAVHDDQLGFLSADPRGWFTRGIARYYVAPDIRLQASGGYARIDIPYEEFGASLPSMTNNFWEWGAKAEYRFSGTPFSVFLDYEGIHNDTNIPLTVLTINDTSTRHMVLAGIRLYSGEGTLLANDRTGATLEINEPLSRLHAASAQFCFLSVCPSDARLKRDVEFLYRLDNGIGIYRYRYAWDDTVYIGVIAQEVATIMPGAVLLGRDGYLRVDYGRLGLQLMSE